MVIDLIDEANYLNESHQQLIEAVIALTAKKLQLNQESEVDISIVDNESIHALNKQYRNIDRPTDVLSFALNEGEEDWDFSLDEQEEVFDIPQHYGDIIISYQKIGEQAEEYGHSFERELAFLVVHGFLHLNGFDHQTSEEEQAMFALQEEVLREYGLTR
ncbi:rRNA maturation RNase YbeY [Tuanshanicoccus lijuaniae]|uniref:rRNA maturation RNase YbeY n=1 Tax=Aerococcaceae bacterium zg-1292 TaxID=2774330 RepID=UPI001936D170|nr:rRNA maturation RNase YbeY [Aerococcaceae bacterium zg-1292]MBF6625705.1 rRNA maturation RNase YbeY [Aerococcaceae bacterium zg-BR9]MBS4455903.1 rRNA maturation RNase YbeY [Aerococcaceae bacterium zg-A91]MBS4457559.1 rRNA maturation RNase YbeY [Aerococcaceae bacterium zg-BR33]QQA38085.1 rRNA maturation RNase YbeY [Aerococcaceae bacterium zg-1292]